MRNLSEYLQTESNHAIKMAEQVTLLALKEVTVNIYIYIYIYIFTSLACIYVGKDANLYARKNAKFYM